MTDDPAGNAMTAGTGRPCAFAMAVLARQGGCPLLTMALVGEAERPHCTSPVANTNCRTLHSLLRERSTFALRLPPLAAPLPHAAELRLQCGGLRGLAAALGKPDAAPPDIHALVMQARDAFGGLLGIPFDRVVASVVRWEGRPRAARGGGAP
jgi:hypothetical protein